MITQSTHNQTPVTVIIHTKNSAKTLADTLLSVQWAKEIIVMDMHSTDTTVAIAKSYNAKIFYFDDVGYVEPARNEAISKATQPWICIVDSDEVIPEMLAEKLQALANGDATADAYFIARKNRVFGGWLRSAGWWPDYQLRFFTKGSVVWSDAIHSSPTIDGTVDYLPESEELALDHNNYPTVESFIERLNRYTSHEVVTRLEKTSKQSSKSEKVAPIAPVTELTLLTSWKNELFSRLFKLNGIDAGVRGVGVSYLQAMYELVVQLKIWETQHSAKPDQTTFLKKHKKQETIQFFTEFQKELHYWIADWHINHNSGVSQFIWKIRRKFRV